MWVRGPLLKGVVVVGGKGKLPKRIGVDQGEKLNWTPQAKYETCKNIEQKLTDGQLRCSERKEVALYAMMGCEFDVEKGRLIVEGCLIIML